MELTMVRTGSELVPEAAVDVVSRQRLVDVGMEVLREQGSLTLNLKAVDFMDSVRVGALVNDAEGGV